MVTLRLALYVAFTFGLFSLAYASMSAAYPEALGLLMREGVLTGYPDASFQPKRGVTRAELATVIMRMQPGDSLTASCLRMFQLTPGISPPCVAPKLRV